MKLYKKILIATIFATLSLVVFSAKAYAANRYWVGATDGASINSIDNWSASQNACGVSGGASIPIAGDSVYFTSSCVNGVTIDAVLYAQVLSIASDYSGTITNASGINMYKLSTSPSITCSRTIPGVVTFNGAGTLAGLTIGSGCTINLGASPTVPINGVFAGTFTNNGTITFDSGAFTLNIVNNGFVGFKNYGTIDATNLTSILMGGPYIGYAGSTLALGSTTVTMQVNSFTQNGTQTGANAVMKWDYSGAYPSISCSGVIPGKFVFGGAFYIAGVSINSGCTIGLGASPTTVINGSYAGTFTNNGTITVDSGTWTVSVTNLNFAGFTNNGIINHNGTGFTISSQSNSFYNSGANSQFNAPNLTSFSVGSYVTIGAGGTLSAPIATTFSFSGNLTNGGTVSLNSLTALTVSGALTNSSGATLTLGNTTLTVTGNFTQNGTYNNTGKTIFGGAAVGARTLTCSGVLPGVIQTAWTGTNSSSLTISSGCSVTVDTSVTWKGGGGITNDGTMTVPAGQTWNVAASGYAYILKNNTGATMTFEAGSNLSVEYGDFTQNSTLNGTPLISFIGTSAKARTLTCVGTLPGTIKAAWTGTNSSSLTISSGCSVTLDVSTTWLAGNGITNNGTINIPAGQTWTLTSSGYVYTITNNGTINHNGVGWSLNSSGSVGSITNGATGVLNYSGTDLTITGSLTNNSGGAMTLGSTTLSVGGSFNQSGTLSGMTGITIFNGSTASTLTCSGTFPGVIRLTKITAGGFTLASGCNVTTEAGPTWTGGDGNVTISTNASLTIPSGTWSLSIGTSVSKINLVNNGTINHNGSDWVLYLSSTGDGTFTNSATGVVNYPGSSLSLKGNLTLNPSGTFDTTGKTIIFNASTRTSTLTCTGTLPGVVRLTQTAAGGFNLASGCNITVDNSVSWTGGSAGVTNNGTITVPSGTWTLNLGSGAASTFLTNNSGGTISHSGTDMTVAGNLTNNSGATMTLGSTTLTIAGSFNQSGTLSGMMGTTVFNTAANATLTCAGTFPGNVQLSKNNTYTLTLAAGCNTFGGNFTTSAGASGNLAITDATLTVAGNVSLGSTGTFGTAAKTLVLSGAGKSLTLNGSNISAIAGLTFNAAGQIYNYVSGTFFTNYTFGANVATVNILGGTFATNATFSGSGQLLYGVSTSTLSGNITFSGSGTALISLGGTATAGTTTISQTTVLSGNSTVYNLTVSAGKTLDLSPDGGSTLYSLTVLGNWLVTGSILHMNTGTVVFNDTNRSVTRNVSGIQFGNVTLTSADTADYTSIFVGGLNYTGNLTIQTTGGTSGKSHTWGISTSTTFTLPGSLTITKTGATPVLSVATTTTWNMIGSGSSFTYTGGTFNPSALNFNGSGVTSVNYGVAPTTGTTTINQTSGSVVLSAASTFFNLVINSGNVLDTSPDGGSTSYNPTINNNFVNNAGETGFLARTGTVIFNHAYRNAAITTGGVTFNNLTLTSAEASGAVNYTTTLNDSFAISGNLTVSNTGTATGNAAKHFWISNVPISISLTGNFVLSQASTEGRFGVAFGNTNVDLNMIGENKSFTINLVADYSGSGYGTYFDANLNFNGSGTTTVSKTHINTSAGTTTINQTSGSVVLAATSTFFNLVINSGKVLSATDGVSSYNMTVYNNFTNNAGETGFVAGEGTVTFDHTSRSPTISAGGVAFYNLIFTSAETGNGLTYTTTLTDNIVVTGNFTTRNTSTSTGVENIHVWSSNVPINISVNGDFLLSQASTDYRVAVSFGNSNVTLNMIGANRSFTVSVRADSSARPAYQTYFNANINFNGSGITMVSKTHINTSSGTTTINQTSGSVILAGASSFYNLVINSGNVIDASPDGGSTSYNLTTNGTFTNSGTLYGRSGADSFVGVFTNNDGAIFNASSATSTFSNSFTNNAGLTGFVVEAGTVVFNHQAVTNPTITTGGVTFNNLTLTSAEVSGSSWYSYISDSFTVNGNLSIAYTGSGSSYYSRTWNGTVPIVITLNGNYTQTGGVSGGIAKLSSNVTLNMTGDGESFTTTNSGAHFFANLNFNGSGTTLVSTGGTWSAGTTTINQSSGSVVLSSNSTFYSLVINSSNVLDSSPDGGTTSYDLTIYNNFTNNAGETGFVTREGTVTFDHTNASTNIMVGDVSFYNLIFNSGDSAAFGASTYITGDIQVLNNFSVLYRGVGSSAYSHSWIANSPISINIAGNLRMSKTAGALIYLGDSNVTINMTGANKSFIVTAGTFKANLNFNGSGTTWVNAGGTWSTGTTTMNQVSGSVNLFSNSTFNNLVINSGNIFRTYNTSTNTVYGPSSGLVGYWRLDETSTSTPFSSLAFDSSGYGNSGTWDSILVPTIVTPPALSGYSDPYALQLTSANRQMVVVPTFNVNNITISAWVYINTLPSSLTAKRIVTKFAGSGAPSGNIFFDVLYASASTGYIRFGISDGTWRYIDSSQTSTTVTTGQWYHIVATYDGTTEKIYLNGSQVASGTALSGNIPTSATPWYIGGDGGASYTYFADSYIDDVRIYNRALAPAEITALTTGSTVSSTQILPAGSSLTINGNFTNYGTLDGGSSTSTAITITGNTTNYGTFIASAGTTTITGAIFEMKTGSIFNHNNGTFFLNGTNQEIRSPDIDMTFYNFYKVGNATLTLNSGSTYTMLGIATLQGTGNTTRLKLTPSLNGTPWNLNPTGTRVLNFLSPWYSNNIGPTIDLSAFASAAAANPDASPPTECAASVPFCDRGYNSNWIFGSSTLRGYWVGWRSGCDGNVSTAACWASTSGGAGPLTPTTAFTLYFDGGAATSSATFDASALASYAGVNISSAYGGTITQAKAISLTSQGWVQNGGTFNGSSAGFTTNSFTQGGGVFNSPTTVTSSGSFVVSNGIFNASSTINVAGSLIDNTIGGTTDLSSGMVGYWKLDETQSPAVDFSGNGNDGTWVGSPSAISSTPVPPIQFSDPNALTLNGSSQYVRQANLFNMSSNGVFTVSAWIKPSSVLGTYIIMTDSWIAAAQAGWAFYVEGTGNKLKFIASVSGANWSYKTGDKGLTDGNWHHVAMVFNNKNITFYIDGALDSSGTVITGGGSGLGNGTMSTATFGTVIGANYNTNNSTFVNYFKGSIDDTRIYNRALSASEVAALALGRNSGMFSGGAFLTASSTVNLTGTSQTLTSQGTTTFWNLAKTSANATLTFTANKVFQILNNLTLAGASNTYLNLRSSSPGTQWKILPNTSATNAFSLLNIQDSNNIATQALNAAGSQDGLRNTNWVFSTPGTTIGWSGTQVATTTVPYANGMLGGAFTASRSSTGNDLYINSIKFTQRGSLPNDNISNVRLYYNQKSGACDDGLTFDGLAAPTGVGTASYEATGKYNFTTSIPVAYGTTTCMYLRYDTIGSPSISLVGKSIDFVVLNPLTDVIMDSGSSTPSSVIDIQGANRATTIDGGSLGLGTVLSIRTSLNPPEDTLFYASSSALWMKEGDNAPVRLTPSTITASDFSFVKYAPTNNTQVVKIILNINELDPKNPQKPSYSKTFNITATVRISN